MPLLNHLLRSLACATLLLSPSLALAEAAQQPGTMSVATFMSKAEALQAKGAMALFSSDISLLKAAVTGSAQAFRRQIKAEAASGKPSACPPERASLTSDDLLAHMRTYPAEARPRIPVSQAVAELFRKRYPCPAR
jgi:hypothetical protein